MHLETSIISRTCRQNVASGTFPPIQNPSINIAWIELSEAQLCICEVLLLLQLYNQR